MFVAETVWTCEVPISKIYFKSYIQWKFQRKSVNDSPERMRRELIIKMLLSYFVGNVEAACIVSMAPN